MKSIKKAVAFTLVAAMAVAMVGCSKKTDKFLIATDTTFAPFEFQKEAGEMVGIDLD